MFPGQRGRGVGTALLARVLEAAQERYTAVSLSVTASNPARRLYERAGFIVLKEEAGTLTMQRTFGKGGMV